MRFLTVAATQWVDSDRKVGEDFRWGAPAERLPGAVVEFLVDPAEVRRSMG